MTVDLVISNCVSVLDSGPNECGLAIDEGKIVAIAKDPLLPDADRKINAQGGYILPGIIDPHVHLGTKYPLDEDLSLETPGAVAGGVTTIGDMLGSPGCFLPHRNLPTCEEDVKSWLEAFPHFKEIGEANSFVDFFVSPQVQSEIEVNEMQVYAEKFGITSVKFYAHMKRPDLTDVNPQWKSRIGLPCDYDDGLIYLAMKNAAKIGPPEMVMVHCENSEMTSRLTKALKISGRKDPAAWQERSSGLPEAEHVRRYAYLARVAGCRLYAVHISSELGLRECRNAILDGTDLIAETCPQYLAKTRDDPEGYLLKVNPPIQKRDDALALWQGIVEGTIKCIGTDHVVQTKHHKLSQDDLRQTEGDRLNIWEVGSGSTGLNTLLPVMWTEGVRAGRISIEKLVQICSSNVAKAFGLFPKKGTLSVGSDADLVLVHPSYQKRITADILRTRSDYTLFEGKEAVGWPSLTILRGKIIYEEDQIVGKKGDGLYQRRVLSYK
jgi:dihydropyrimidinase